jgi:ribonuclease III
VVMGLFGERIADAASGPGGDDYKTRLQELAAQRFEKLPRYQVHDEGPDHAKRFFATVMLGGEPHGSGEGGSKKQAEQAAARAAWRWLSTQGDGGVEGEPGEGTPNTGTTAGSMGGSNAGAT